MNRAHFTVDFPCPTSAWSSSTGGIGRLGLSADGLERLYPVGHAMAHHPRPRGLSPDVRQRAVPQVDRMRRQDAHVLRPQPPVLRRVPMRRKLRAHGRHIVEAFQCLPARAIRAQPPHRASHALCDRGAPLVSAFAQPPDALPVVGEDLGRRQRVLIRMPLLRDLGEQCRQVVLARNELDPAAGEAIVETALGSSRHGLLPFETAVGAFPGTPPPASTPRKRADSPAETTP